MEDEIDESLSSTRLVGIVMIVLIAAAACLLGAGIFLMGK